ncbi:hypothetical protein [Absidia glauca]|uniref:Uncharacterized protein n=1 Tax=Absidia glauca TaxID=4829 RepID=A0A163JYQ3_ABSGL|nr:hypothetical protein [Absidia glauca]
MDKNLNWAAAKQAIKKQYGGDHSLSWYLEKLTNMRASKHENPVIQVRRKVLHRAAWCRCGRFFKQVRATFASTDPAHRPPFNVAYVAKVVPLLYVDAVQDDEDKDQKKQRRQEHRGHPYQGHKGNKGNGYNGSNNGNNGNNGNKRFKKGSGLHPFKTLLRWSPTNVATATNPGTMGTIAKSSSTTRDVKPKTTT